MKRSLLVFARCAVVLAGGTISCGYARAADASIESFTHLWEALCPVAGYRHAFVDFGDLQSLLGVDPEKPVSIDPWTSVSVSRIDDSSRFTARLEVSRFDNGRTSGWIEQDPSDSRIEMRSELTLFIYTAKGHLTVHALEKSLTQLGFHELSNKWPGARMGEKVYGKDQFFEEVRIRYIEAAENAPDVRGITLIGYRWKGQPTIPVIQGACP